MNSIRTAQELLYKWIKHFNHRSYDQIRENCDYLNSQYNLGIDSHSVWKIFYPLFYSGVIDHIGNGYYAATEPLFIDFGRFFIYVGTKPRHYVNDENVGLYITDMKDSQIVCKENKFKAIDILRTYPSIDTIVDGFNESMHDEKDLEFHDYKNKRGVAELKKGGLIRCFSIPQELYQRQIPDKSINPDALNISYYYERSINGEINGQYETDKNILRLKSFGLPIMIYRTLLLDCCSRGYLPKLINNEYEFDGISQGIVKELNRIICKSISNE